MNTFMGKQYQRGTNLALAALLVVSTLTASVPFFFSEKASASAPLTSANIIVDKAILSDGETTTYGKPAYSTIPAAIAAATSNQTIIVRDGIYSDVTAGYTFLRLPQNKPLKLHAENNHGAIITVGVVIKNTGGYTLDGFQIKDVNDDYGLWVDNTSSPAASTLITNNKITNIFADNGKEVEGIFVGDSSKTYSNVTISYNTVSNITSNTKAVSGIAANGTGANVSIIGNTISNTLRGINTAALKVGSSVQVNSNTAYSNVVTPLELGPYATQVGNITAAPDATKPTVEVLNVGTATFNKDDVISIKAADNSSLDKVVANVRNSAGTIVLPTQSSAAGQNPYVHTIALAGLAEGSYSVRYNAVDAAGNLSTTKSLDFLIDNTKPTITVRSDSIGSGNVFSVVNFNLYDAKGIDKVEINGVTKELTDNAYSNVNGIQSGVFGGREGLNTIVAYDVAGNTTSSTFTLDNTKPTITIKPESIGNGIYSNVSFKLFDTYQIDKVTVNGVVKELTNNNYGDLNNLKPGTLGATQGLNTVVVHDVAGNSTTTTVSLDSNAPLAPINALPAAINSNDFYFTWDAVTDLGSPVVEYQFQSSSSSVMSGSSLASSWKNWVNYVTPEQKKLTTPTIHSTGTPDGTYYWQVRTIDAAGNVGEWSTVWTTVIDTTSATAPTGLNWLNGTSGVLGVFTKENLVATAWAAPTVGTVKNYEYSYKAPNADWSTPSLQPVTPTTIADQSFGGVEGAWQFRIRTVNQFDVRSDWVESSVLIYDKTAPTGTATLSDTLVNKTDASPILTAQLADASSAITDLKYRVFRVNADGSTTAVTGVIGALAAQDGAFNSKSETVVTVIDTTPSVYTDGDYRVQLYIYDAAGLQGKKTVNFVVNKTPPVITSGSFEQDGNEFTSKYTIPSDVVFAWTPDLDNIEDGVAFDATQLSPVFTVTKDGTYAFTLKVTDGAGNTTSERLVFTYTTPLEDEGDLPVLGGGTTNPDAAPVVPAATIPAAAFTGVIGATADAAVLGATTDATDTTGNADVKGLSTDNFAAVDTNKTNSTDGKVFGIAWFWWILILAILSVAAYSVTRAIRRRNAEQN